MNTPPRRPAVRCPTVRQRHSSFRRGSHARNCPPAAGSLPGPSELRTKPPTATPGLPRPAAHTCAESHLRCTRALKATSGAGRQAAVTSAVGSAVTSAVTSAVRSAVGSAYTTAPSAVVHPTMSLRSSRLVGDRCLDLGVTAVAAACCLCHDHVLPSCPDFVSAPTAQAAREHRWSHIEHLLFECQCIPGLDSSVALTLLRDDLFRVCSGSDHAEAVLLATFPTSRAPTACVVPFLLDPAAALGRMSPWHMKLQRLDLVAAFLLGVSSAVCTRQPPTASVLAHFRLPAWSSVHAWLLYLRTGSDFAPERLPAPDTVFACVHTGALWTMPAWIWRDVRSVFFFFFPEGACVISWNRAARTHTRAPCFLRTSQTTPPALPPVPG